MSETKTFRSEAEAIQYIITRMEKQSAALNNRLVAHDTLIRFMVRALEDVHPDAQGALKIMIEGWHEGLINKNPEGPLRAAFDSIAEDMNSIVSSGDSNRPSFEVIPGGME